MRTDFSTLLNLSSYVLNHLLDKKFIEFNIDDRVKVIDALATEFNVSLATEEDIRDQAIEEVEEKMGYDPDSLPEDITESEMYNHARKEIIKSFQGEQIGGLFLVETINQVAQRATKFLLDNDLIEDVFATDEELVEFMVPKLRDYKPQVPVA